ncbi:MAG: hypothetical protein QNK04_22010 [Myxococcota bacterium]|nr:hypothetical protein [Myxococcota bacterium]
MASTTTTRIACASIAAALALLVGCGGGRTAIVGLGNGGNRIVEGGMLEEVAEALAESPATPEVTDAMITEIFGAVLRRAKEGEPEAALVLLLVAEERRSEGEG